MKTILVVEDNRELLEYLKDLLLENGFGARVAATGAASLNIIKTSPIDLVLLDLGLPDVKRRKRMSRDTKSIARSSDYYSHCQRHDRRCNQRA